MFACIHSFVLTLITDGKTPISPSPSYLCLLTCSNHPSSLNPSIHSSIPSQAKLLQSLGIKSTLITDGKTPINLFQTAQGLVGGMGTPGLGQ